MLTLETELSIIYDSPGHLMTASFDVLCFANVCLLTFTFWNASIPHSTCGDSRSSQLLVKPSPY